MEHARQRKPAHRQAVHPGPSNSMRLAPIPQGPSPVSRHPLPKYTQAVEISRYRVVVEVTLYDRSKPLPGKRHRLMHSLTELLFDFFQLGPLPFADRFAF